MKFSPSVKMATTKHSIGVAGFLSSSYFTREAKSTTSTTTLPMAANKLVVSNHRNVLTFAAQESSASTVAATETKEAAAPAKAAAPVKKPAAAAAAKAKAPVKSLPDTIIEDVIPPLRTILEAQDDISQLELAFADNRLEGSFLKKGIPYSFWAFFPDGSLTGPKGFALSSYGQAASSVEPFLVDEKKVTAKLLVFWVEKRLAAQGIIPVWND